MRHCGLAAGLASLAIGSVAGPAGAQVAPDPGNAGGTAFVMTFPLCKITNPVVGMRVAPGDEVTGLDLTQHGERRYST